jgi:hypothetical protein
MDRSDVDTCVGVSQLLGRYQYFVDAGKLDAVVSLFTSDAVFQTDNNSYIGPRGVRTFFDAVRQCFLDAAFLPARHHLSSICVEPNPDGTASSYACFTLMGTRGNDHWGVYRDRVVLVGGQWMFAARRVSIEGYVPGSPIEKINEIEKSL